MFARITPWPVVMGGIVLAITLAATTPSASGTLGQELSGFIFDHPLIKAGRTTVRSSGENINIGGFALNTLKKLKGDKFGFPLASIVLANAMGRGATALSK